MNYTHAEFDRAERMTKIICVVLAALFLAIAILTAVIGTTFTDMLFSLFRGM